VAGRVTIGGAGLAAIAAVLLLLASGCGYGGVASASDHPYLPHGATLFSQDCGSCHSLQAAGTSGTIGPDLDNAFAGPRKEGFALSSIENVVLDQIRIGGISNPIIPYTSGKEFTSKKCLSPETKQTCYGIKMPTNIVTGQDAIDVAAYVASVAGVGGYTTPVDFASLGNDGKAIVQAACGSCHTLADAGINGQAPGAPNLDTLMPDYARVLHQVTVGGGIMPSFAGKLTPAQIQAVAKYVSSVTAGK
jgi:mono/diheme cytochrome c family protein